MNADVTCAIAGLRRARVAPRRELERAKETLLRLFASAPGAFWRHDVDLSLRAAVDMGRLHELAGTRATFFLDPRSEHYNLSSRSGAYAISELLEAGQAIGLHCHVRKGEDAPELVYRDQLLLDRAAQAAPGQITRRVSFHIPPAELLWRDFDEFESAYAARWEGRYVSDSRGLIPLADELHDDLQINLHPEWWL